MDIDNEGFLIRPNISFIRVPNLRHCSAKQLGEFLAQDIFAAALFFSRSYVLPPGIASFRLIQYMRNKRVIQNGR